MNDDVKKDNFKCNKLANELHEKPRLQISSVQWLGLTVTYRLHLPSHIGITTLCVSSTASNVKLCSGSFSY